jgi:hypothetical protein
MLPPRASNGSALSEADWLEAFSHHPQIGDRAALEARFPDARSVVEEQSGIGSPAPT